MFRHCLVAAAAGLVAAPAFAGNLTEPQTAPVVQPTPQPTMTTTPSNDWSGFYLGGQVGYGNIESDELDSAADVDDDDLDFNGATYGLHGGYLYDFGKIVAGAEVAFNGTNIEQEELGLEVDSLSTAKLRLGYDAGNWMPYVAAGGTRAQFSGDGDDIEADGGYGGIGVDYQMSENIRVGGEIGRHTFEEIDDTDIDADATTAEARMSFQF